MSIIESMFRGKLSQEDTQVVKLAVIGTSTAGKTYLLNAIHRLIFGGTAVLKNGLRMGALNAEDTTVKYKQIKENIKVMQKMPLPSTTCQYDFEFQLLHKVKPILRIVYHDNVGQILTNDDSSIASDRSQFVKIISKSDIVWLLLPMQTDGNGKYIGVKREDIVLAEGYLQEALQNRNSNSKLVFAILLTKADVLEDIEDEKSKQEIRKLHGELKCQFEWLTSCDFISASALFPVSAFGFGNAQVANIGTDDPDEVNYTLVGNDLNPYNVHKLLLWSLVCAGYQNKLLTDSAIIQNISNNMQELNGLCYPFKGGY